MLYIEGSDEMYRQLTDATPDYIGTPEVIRDLPEPPRKKIKKNN